MPETQFLFFAKWQEQKRRKLNIDPYMLIQETEIQKIRNIERGVFMLAEIRGRSQITIPSEIIKKLGISEGDKFDIMERDGGIFLCPVVVYPKDKIAKIAKILKESENDTKTRTAFESVEDMFSDMGIDIDNV